MALLPFVKTYFQIHISELQASHLWRSPASFTLSIMTLA